jgi:hypothetical protein
MRTMFLNPAFSLISATLLIVLWKPVNLLGFWGLLLQNDSFDFDSHQYRLACTVWCKMDPVRIVLRCDLKMFNAISGYSDSQN